MAERSGAKFRSGDALFAFDAGLTIVFWNRAAENLTGVSAGEAVGRRCWELLGGHDERGGLVCHAGCSTARLAREGWPVPCQGLLVSALEGDRPVNVSTVAVDDGERQLFLHVIVPHEERAPPEQQDVVTPRQLEILRLLADGVHAKGVAIQLGIAETTVRNHIHGLLVALGAHSQLEAIAIARRRQIVD